MLAVVLSFDQFPLSLLGCYGNARARTPMFDRIASESIVFDQHFGEDFSPNPPGHAWWSAGRQFPQAEIVGPELSESLKDVGVCSIWLTDAKESSIAPLPKRADVRLLDDFALVIKEGTKLLSDWAGDVDASRLLWLKLGDSVWEARGENFPSDAVEQIDRALLPLWDAAQSAGESRPVLFLFTAARGLFIRETASRSAVPKEATEESVHLPLIVHHSEHAEGGRSPELTQSMDLRAVLRNFFATRPAQSREGGNFLEKICGSDFPERDAITYGSHEGWEAILTRQFHLVRVRDPKSPGAEKRFLFLKPEDVWDWHDVASQEPKMTETLSEKMDAILSAAEARPDAD